MGKIIKNIGWLIFDRIFILVLQFFIGVKIDKFGDISLESLNSK